MPLLDYVTANYNLSQKEYTAFGTIANKGKISNEGLNALQISKLLNKNIKTIERNLKVLKEDNKIEFVGAKKTGGYYLKK